MPLLVRRTSKRSCVGDGRWLQSSASGHIVSLRHPAATAGQAQATLASQHHINTSSRNGGIRVSLHAYNSSDDIRALTQALASISPH